MNIEQTQKEFQQKICADISITEEGAGRYRVSTPFTFDDGDHPVITLIQDEKGIWRLTDEGHTIMRLTFLTDEEDLRTVSRQKILRKSLQQYGIREEAGELCIPLNEVSPADALFSLIQGIIRISEASGTLTQS